MRNNLERKLTRTQLEANPRYSDASVVDKIAMENIYLPEMDKYRGKWMFSMMGIGAAAAPILTALFYENAFQTKPTFVNYGAGVVLGTLAGFILNLVLGTIAYETLSQEGKINKFFSNIQENRKRK